MSVHLARFPLATLPTPLHDAARLREALGGPSRAPRILIKRDDLTGLAYGGNKVRKLKLLVADALAQGATTLITAGAAQSNHARATAAAAVLAGLRAVLVLDTNEPDAMPTGNLLLDRLLGADVRFVPSGSDSTEEMERVAGELRRAGERPYIIPVGGSSPIGAAGYTTMTAELAGQLRELGAVPDAIYFGNGSRGTQAGIIVGASLHGIPGHIRGVVVSENTPEKVQRAIRLANEAALLLGSDLKVTNANIENVEGYVGDGYGKWTAGGAEAIRLLARTEAVFLDPVYTGKAMAGLLDHIRAGVLEPEQTVIFVHTGGTPSLFANPEGMAAIARAE